MTCMTTTENPVSADNDMLVQALATDGSALRFRNKTYIRAGLPTAELARENRTLRWKLKSLGRTSGKQGQIIHELRNKVDALMHTADLRSMSDYRALLERARAAEAENRRLREKLSHIEDPHVHVAMKP